MVRRGSDDSTTNGQGAQCAGARGWPMVFKKDSQKRRSDRLMLTIPVRVEGLDDSGEPFECGGQAVGINRHGAYVHLDRPISASQKILLTNLENKLRREFRVVGIREKSSTEETDLGVEAVDDCPSFWGIDFPAGPRKPGESRGLLECRQCHTASLLPLSPDEIEVLESGGTVKRPCASCGTKTDWGFAKEGSRADNFLPEPDSATDGDDDVPDVRRRGKPVVFVQRPVSIRTAAGDVETVQTENLSKDEIRCTSEKNYEVNQAVTLEWENSGDGQRLRIQGRIRRRQMIAGSSRRIYSIRHEGSTATLPPAPLKPARKLYVAMGGLVAAASVLLGVSVWELVSSLSVPSGEARRVACLGGVLLLLLPAYLAWKTILAREPESRKGLRKRHLMAGTLVAVFFLGALGVGALGGLLRGYQRQQAQQVLHDLSMARVFESNIDAAENRVLANPSDYADACASLQMLAGPWQNHLDALTAHASELYRFELWPNPRSSEALKGLDEIVALDRRKLQLVRKQTALAGEAQSVDPDKQQAFWQSRFPPLRQEILELNAQKNRLAQSLMAVN